MDEACDELLRDGQVLGGRSKGGGPDGFGASTEAAGGPGFGNAGSWSNRDAEACPWQCHFRSRTPSLCHAQCSYFKGVQSNLNAGFSHRVRPRGSGIRQELSACDRWLRGLLDCREPPRLGPHPHGMPPLPDAGP